MLAISMAYPARMAHSARMRGNNERYTGVPAPRWGAYLPPLDGAKSSGQEAPHIPE